MSEVRSSGEMVEKSFCYFVDIFSFVITSGGIEQPEVFFQVHTELAIDFFKRGLLAKLFLLVLKSKAAVSLVKSI